MDIARIVNSAYSPLLLGSVVGVGPYSPSPEPCGPSTSPPPAVPMDHGGCDPAGDLDQASECSSPSSNGDTQTTEDFAMWKSLSADSSDPMECDQVPLSMADDHSTWITDEELCAPVCRNAPVQVGVSTSQVGPGRTVSEFDTFTRPRSSMLDHGFTPLQERPSQSPFKHRSAMSPLPTLLGVRNEALSLLSAPRSPPISLGPLHQGANFHSDAMHGVEAGRATVNLPPSVLAMDVATEDGSDVGDMSVYYGRQEQVSSQESQVRQSTTERVARRRRRRRALPYSRPNRQDQDASLAPVSPASSSTHSSAPVRPRRPRRAAAARSMQRTSSIIANEAVDVRPDDEYKEEQCDSSDDDDVTVSAPRKHCTPRRSRATRVRSSPYSTPSRSSSEQTPRKFKGPTVTCPDCGKIFGGSYNMTRHMRTHTGERPYKCRHCKRRFRESHHRDTHENMHTGNGVVFCFACAARFSSQSNLSRHRRTNLHYREALALHTQLAATGINTPDEQFLWESCLLDSTVWEVVKAKKVRSVAAAQAIVLRSVPTAVKGPEAAPSGPRVDVRVLHSQSTPGSARKCRAVPTYDVPKDVHTRIITLHPKRVAKLATSTHSSSSSSSSSAAASSAQTPFRATLVQATPSATQAQARSGCPVQTSK